MERERPAFREVGGAVERLGDGGTRKGNLPVQLGEGIEAPTKFDEPPVLAETVQGSPQGLISLAKEECDRGIIKVGLLLKTFQECFELHTMIIALFVHYRKRNNSASVYDRTWTRKYLINRQIPVRYTQEPVQALLVQID
ncbi:MAG: hypothetical protein CVV51_10465 [Spirochaetae bacterium HGW-Spirochaetae-7]|nr:MAG: hypothetical protein CVV51_10465 [Spirochaetae bacterium HGW-Spirochaetae-7]